MGWVRNGQHLGRPLGADNLNFFEMLTRWWRQRKPFRWSVSTLSWSWQRYNALFITNKIQCKFIIYRNLGITPISFFFPYAPIESHRLRDKARKEMVQIFSKVIQQRREEPEDIRSQRTDILQIFIDMKYKDDSTQLSNDEVVGLLIALLFAGNSYIPITITSIVVRFKLVESNTMLFSLLCYNSN